jgi:hypothetical protein
VPFERAIEKEERGPQNVQKQTENKTEAGNQQHNHPILTQSQ